jgi:hypothetical protein
MTFTVIWRPTAERRLAQIWIDGPDRRAVSAAANAIDAGLKRDPLTQGESRFGSRVPLWIFDKVVIVQEFSLSGRLINARIDLALFGADGV